MRKVTVMPAAIGILLLPLTGCLEAEAARRGNAAKGAAIFSGAAEIQARLAGQTEDLPGMATACANCHEAKSKQPSSSGGPAGAATTYAHPLNRAWLATEQKRHGGPASVYTPASLCVLLRTGVDPAQVMIPTTMPRYQVTDSQCADLWAFFEGRQ